MEESIIKSKILIIILIFFANYLAGQEISIDNDDYKRLLIDELINKQYKLKSATDKYKANDTILIKDVINKIYSLSELTTQDKVLLLEQVNIYTSISNQDNYSSIQIIEQSLNTLDTLEYLNSRELCHLYYHMKSRLIYRYSWVNDLNKMYLCSNQVLRDYEEQCLKFLIPEEWKWDTAESIASIYRLSNPEGSLVIDDMYKMELDSKGTIYKLKNRVNSLNKIGLKSDELRALRELVEQYEQKEEITRFDSTEIAMAYNSLARHTKNIHYYFVSNKFQPHNDWCNQISGNLNNILNAFDKNNLKDSIDFYFKKWYANEKIVSCDEFLNVRINYHSIRKEWNNILELTEPILKVALADNLIQESEFSIIHNNLIAKYNLGKREEFKATIDNARLKKENFKTYYGSNFSLELLKTEYFLTCNLDSAMYYLKEQISTVNAEPENGIKDFQTIEVYKRAIENLQFRKSNNPGYKFLLANDTICVDDIVWDSPNLKPRYFLGDHDCLVRIERLFDKVNLVIASKKGTLHDEYYNIAINEKDIVKLTNGFKNIIEDYIQSYENIYLLANAEFSLINYSAQEFQDLGINWGKKFNIFRITSEDDLISLFNVLPDKRSNDQIQVSIYGSPNFSSNTEILTQSFGSTTRAVKNDDGQWAYLKGALDETKNISSIMNQHGYNISSFTGNNASEKNIRDLASPDILHIATHGFIDTSTISTTYGLVFAGANEKKNNEINDGYLYSEDIGQLNLKNTKLAVVSACETGKYDEETDYTIVNALFDSGVDHQMVTLWKIKDDETNDLMTSFYNNLAQTKNIRTSYELAQNFMKEKYKDPYIWSSFILLSQDLNYKI